MSQDKRNEEKLARDFMRDISALVRKYAAPSGNGFIHVERGLDIVRQNTPLDNWQGDYYECMLFIVGELDNIQAVEQEANKDAIDRFIEG